MELTAICEFQTKGGMHPARDDSQQKHGDDFVIHDVVDVCVVALLPSINDVDHTLT